MFSTKDGVVIGISGLAALAAAYLMLEASRREQRAELAAMEARLLATIEAAHAPQAQAPTAAVVAAEPSAPDAAAVPVLAEAAEPEQAIAVAAREPSAPTHPLLGSWRCAFRSGEYSYPPMACEVRRKDGGYTLEKTQGSQRIKGALTLEGDARFTFSGLFFCPHGACDAKVRGDFTRKSKDHWVGTLRGMESDDIVVTLKRPAP